MKSANTSVTGPAAILGSSLNQCRSEGTAKPNAQAVTSESAMLPPITTAARKSSCHTQAMIQTTNPQETPRSAAVASSRRNADASQSQVTLTERNAWIVTLIDCTLTLSFNPRTIVRKNA